MPALPVLKWLKAPLKRPVNQVFGLLSSIAILAGCAVSTPYREPSQQPATAGAQTLVVAITEATLSSDRAARAVFWEGVWRIERELPRQQGLVGYSLRQELLGNRVWTMTTWTSEADLRRFASSPLHRDAVRAGAGAIAGLRFTRLTRASGLPPVSWEQALDALEKNPALYE